MNRPGVITGERKSEDAELETKAFESFARRGIERMAADEIKSLVVATDASGGYIAPEAFGNELLKALVQYSPLRSYAKVVTIGASAVKYPKRLTSLAASWVGETAARSESEPTFGQLTITPHELATYVDVSQQLLEDNAYNLTGELAAEFAEQFGKAEGTAFVKGSGDGNNQPVGLMASAAITNIIVTGVADNFAATDPADAIFDLFHALPAVHAQNGTWLMNRTTLATVRKWKDGNGRYLIVDPISAGAPMTLLGRPIAEMIDMDDVGANTYPIAFGDMSGYRVVDRVSLSVLRDPFTQAASGIVRFHARKRVGADVTHPDRIVKLKCSV
jgi:HK97 family phage major capsid protein